MSSLLNSAPSGPIGDVKYQIMEKIRQEAAQANAQMLVKSIQKICSKRCIPKPGTSMSSGEQQCFTYCTEKYMAAWNICSRSFLDRIAQEGGAPGL